MKTKSILMYIWKLPVCGVSFFIGMALAGALLPTLGFQSPQMPEGADANTIAMWYLFSSLLLAFALSHLSKNLSGNFFKRWMILSAFTWGVGSIGMVLESCLFMETGAVSSLNSTIFTILNFLPPSLFVCALVVILFKSKNEITEKSVCVSMKNWFWKIAAALLAYPIAYFTFGLLVQPFVMDFYIQGLNELTLPTWGQLIPLQLGRSLLFFMLCLPILANWKNSRLKLWLSLGSSFFILTAFMAVITSYWFPWQMRVFHGLEMLADAAVYCGALVLLFNRKKK